MLSKWQQRNLVLFTTRKFALMGDIALQHKLLMLDFKVNKAQQGPSTCRQVAAHIVRATVPSLPLGGDGVCLKHLKAESEMYLKHLRHTKLNIY